MGDMADALEYGCPDEDDLECCDICGELHDLDNMPRECETGDGAA